MSITSPDARISEYNPVVATTEFAAGFPVFDNDDLIVIHDGEERDDFAVSATYVEGIANDAKAVFAVGITGNVLVVGARAPRRTNRFQNGGPLPTRDQNLALDTVEGEVQELRRDMGRAVLAAYGESGPSLPAPDGNKLLGWDGNGGLENKLSESQSQAAAEAAADVAVAAATGGLNVQGFSTIAAAEAWTPAAGLAPAYLRIYSATAVEYGGKADWVKVASEPLHDGKFSMLDAGGNVIWYEAVSPVAIDPRLFGARARNDATDAAIDGQAILDAWDRAAQTNNNTRRIIDLGRGHYIVNQDYDFTGIHHVSMVGPGAGACIIAAQQLTAGSLFKMGNQNFKARGFRVEMPDALDTAATERYLFDFDRPDGDPADIDCEFVNVELSRAKHAIRHRGRGLKLQNSLISVCDYPIDWGWKNAVPGASPNYTADADGVGSDMAGARGVVIQNNRFHSNTNAWFRNVGANGDKLAGLLFTGNLGDIGRTMVDTQGRWLTIVGNQCLQATGEACLIIRGGVKRAVIANNIFGGSDGIPTERDPDNFVQIRGNNENIKLIGNYFYRCTNHGVDVRDGVTTKFVATKNTFELPCTAGGSFAPFAFVGAGHTGKVYHNDIDSSVALTGVVRTDNAGTTIEVGHHDFWNASFPLAVGTSLKYHATLAEKGAWTPQLQFGGANSGMSITSSGKWTRNGDQCVADFVITLTTKGASAGAATIAGLATGAPLAVPGNANSVGSVMATGVANLTSTIQAQLASSGQLDLYDNAATGRTSLDDTNFANGSVIRGSIAFNIT